MIKKEKGITLISLVITIVIMLILAAVSVSFLMGGNGLIKRAQSSTKEYGKSAIKEKIETILAEWNLEHESNGAELFDFLNSKVPTELDAVKFNEEDDTIDIYKDEYDYKVNMQGEIVKSGDVQKEIEVSNLKIVLNEDGSGDNIAENSLDYGNNNACYIVFDTSIIGGEVICDKILPFKVTENGTYIFNLTSNVNGIDYSLQYKVEVKTFKVLIKVYNIRVVNNSNGTGSNLNADSVEYNGTCYIAFESTIMGGIVNVNPGVPYRVSENGNYKFNLSATVDGQDYNDSIDVTVNQFQKRKLSNVVKVGDYVAYDAGTWTQTEINNLSSLYQTSGVPSSQGKFGGFKAGQSRNKSVYYSGSSATIGTYANGWRVLSNNNGIIKLISASTSELYYHLNGTSTAYDSANILSNTRNWSMYKNSYASRVYCASQNDLSSFSQSDGMRNTNQYYWLSNAYDGPRLSSVHSDGNFGHNYNYAWGLRIIIELVSNVNYVSGSGTISSPYIFN